MRRTYGTVTVKEGDSHGDQPAQHVACGQHDDDRVAAAGTQQSVCGQSGARVLLGLCRVTADRQVRI